MMSTTRSSFVSLHKTEGQADHHTQQQYEATSPQRQPSYDDDDDEAEADSEANYKPKTIKF